MQEIALFGLWRAKFFDHAAFYCGTALRILFGLDRFSEDLDFSLLAPQTAFSLAPYEKQLLAEFHSLGLPTTIKTKIKTNPTSIFSV